jgi:hypothetical protein
MMGSPKIPAFDQSETRLAVPKCASSKSLEEKRCFASVHRLNASFHQSRPHSCPSFQFMSIFLAFHSIVSIPILFRRFSHFWCTIPLHPAHSSPLFEHCQLWGLNPTARAIKPKSLRAIRCTLVISKHGLCCRFGNNHFYRLDVRFCHFELAGSPKIPPFDQSDARLLPCQNLLALENEDIPQHSHREIIASRASSPYASAIFGDKRFRLYHKHAHANFVALEFLDFWIFGFFDFFDFFSFHLDFWIFYVGNSDTTIEDIKD